MPILTLTVTMDVESNLDDSMAILEQQVSEALGWLGEVQTCDIEVIDEGPISSPDSTGYSDDEWEDES